MKHIFILLFCFLLSNTISAQDQPENILTLSLAEEPVTLQKNRIQSQIGYQYEALSHYFDNSGSRSEIIFHDLTGNMNRLNLFVGYGLNDYFQLEVNGKYQWGFESYGNYMKSYSTHALNYSSVQEISGFDDWLITMGCKLPIRSQLFEFAVFPGIYIPMSNNPDEPNYEIEALASSNISNVNMTTYKKVGSGTYRYSIAGKSKFHLNKQNAIELFGQYSCPIETGESYEWDAIFKGEDYFYEQNNFTYSPAKVLYGNAKLQIVPDKKEIMGILIGSTFTSQFDGWKEFKDKKSYQQNSNLVNIYAGLELIVSDHIRYHQKFWYDIAGKNSIGTFGFQTTFTFNFLRK